MEVSDNYPLHNGSESPSRWSWAEMILSIFPTQQRQDLTKYSANNFPLHSSNSTQLLAADSAFQSLLQQLKPCLTRQIAPNPAKSANNKRESREIRANSAGDSKKRAKTGPTSANNAENGHEASDSDSPSADDTETVEIDPSFPASYQLAPTVDSLERVLFILSRDSVSRGELARAVGYSNSKVSRLLASIARLKNNDRHNSVRKWLFAQDQQFSELIAKELHLNIEGERVICVNLRSAAPTNPSNRGRNSQSSGNLSEFTAADYNSWLDYKASPNLRTAVDSQLLKWLENAVSTEESAAPTKSSVPNTPKPTNSIDNSTNNPNNPSDSALPSSPVALSLRNPADLPTVSPPSLSLTPAERAKLSASTVEFSREIVNLCEIRLNNRLTKQKEGLSEQERAGKEEKRLTELYSTSEDTDIKQRTNFLITKLNLRCSELAVLVNSSVSTLSSVLKNTYKYKSVGLYQNLRRWIKETDQQMAKLIKIRLTQAAKSEDNDENGEICSGNDDFVLPINTFHEALQLSAINNQRLVLWLELSTPPPLCDRNIIDSIAIDAFQLKSSHFPALSGNNSGENEINA
jgi:DNA-binding transcriptional regulator GbsR (MarR family)